MMNDPRLRPLPLDLLSVQSQVVYGRVGNNVALPTLDALGLAAAAVPTVVFSNTPHYPSMHGGAIPPEWFAGYLDDLVARGAAQSLRAVLVGYLGSPQQAAVLARWTAAQQQALPQLRVVIDPVIGDHDHGIYVDPGMVQAYRRHLLPLAHGLTPNHFELERLVDRPLHRLDEVIAAARGLLNGRTEWMAVTSAAPDSGPPDEMRVALVTRGGAQLITHVRVDAAPKGTGDLFSAAITGHWLLGDSLQQAALKACDRVVAALQQTRRAQCAELLLPGNADMAQARYASAVQTASS